ASQQVERWLGTAPPVTLRGISLPREEGTTPSPARRAPPPPPRGGHHPLPREEGTTPSPTPAPTPGTAVVGVDLGQIHPTRQRSLRGRRAVVLGARCLRAAQQDTAKRLAALQARQAKHRQAKHRQAKKQQ